MSPPTADIESLVKNSLLQLRSDLGLEALSSIHRETAILGGDSDLDSMAVVHLIVDLESRLQEEFGRNWILADERALSRHRSPFRTLGDLSDFIVESTPEA